MCHGSYFDHYHQFSFFFFFFFFLGLNESSQMLFPRAYFNIAFEKHETEKDKKNKLFEPLSKQS